MVETADLVVVGGGIVGCAVVHQLAQVLPASTRIVLLDRGPIAGATSGSSMGHLMVTPDDAAAYALTSASVRLWRELQAETGGFDFQDTGALYLADTDEDLALLPVLRDQFVARGDAAELLDARQLRELEPGLAGDLAAALHYRGDAVVLPMPACAAMLRAARQRCPGIDVRPCCEVTGFDRDGDRIAAVRTARGPIATRNVVNAAGVWAPELAERCGQPRLPIFPRAGNLAVTGHHTTPVRTQLLEVSYLRFAHGVAAVDPSRTDDPGGQAVNVQPQSCGSCLIGSTRRFRGFDRTLDRELLHRSLLRACRYVPGLAAAPVVRAWVGLRPYAIDKQPLVGPWPPVRGLWLAAGHEGLGITLGPITGRLLAQQIAGLPADVEARHWLPARFCA
ncbi:MAG: FAD-binding oxidoreductase [Planctomycetes bacterium]|nr:FAD-binding oxidoreductase [Planctomycetota bacterium]